MTTSSFEDHRRQFDADVRERESREPIFVGIDPGKTGAIVFFDGASGPPFRVEKIPVIAGATKRTVSAKTGKPSTKKLAPDRYDPLEIAKLFYPYVTSGRPFHATIEEPSAMVSSPANRNKAFGVKVNYELGRIIGGLDFLFASIQVFCMGENTYELVRPKKWQKAMWTHNTKDPKQNSILTVKRFFPTVELRFSTRATKDNGNIADAVLIGDYGRRPWRQG